MDKHTQQLITTYPELAQVVTDSQFAHTPAFQAVAWAILRKQPLPSVAEIQRVARQGAQ